MSTQRDSFISRLFERAVEDKDIYLISVDMGAPSLDRWRKKLPEQFFAAGISEQHAINFAAGLAARGKKVYVYFMASWVARCFEQVRYSCAMAGNPITILGNGVALGYAPAGPAHEPNEDIAYMRSLCGIEIYSPANAEFARRLVDLTCDEPKLRYIRLERSYPDTLDGLYSENELTKENIKSGMKVVSSGDAEGHKSSICIASSGYMLGRALEVSKELISVGYSVSVLDMWKIKPVDLDLFSKTVAKHDTLVTLEEQTLSGGFGSKVCELVSDCRLKKDVLRIGLPEGYIFENGNREHLLDTNGLSAEEIRKKIIDFCEGHA
jgi:transketolase